MQFSHWGSRSGTAATRKSFSLGAVVGNHGHGHGRDCGHDRERGRGRAGTGRIKARVGEVYILNCGGGGIVHCRKGIPCHANIRPADASIIHSDHIASDMDISADQRLTSLGTYSIGLLEAGARKLATASYGNIVTD